MVEKKLFRMPKEGKFLGICEGFGDYLNIDPVLIRVIFVISLFFSCFTTFLVYLVLALVIPEKK